MGTRNYCEKYSTKNFLGTSLACGRANVYDGDEVDLRFYPPVGLDN